MDSARDADTIQTAIATPEITPQETSVTPQDAPGLDPIVLDACLIAVGERGTDEQAASHRCWAAKRDVNARGNGGESYRRVLRAGAEAWEWLSIGRLPRGTFLASDRRYTITGDGYRGDLLAAYSRGLRGGRSEGRATLDEIRLVVGAHSGERVSVACRHTRRRDGRYDVILPSGHSLTVASPDW